MRVIARKSSPIEQVSKIICPNCECTIEYTERDVEDLDHGFGFYCPECGEEIYTQKFDLHEFPNAFYHFGVNDGAVAISDKETQRYINEVVDYLKDADVGDHAETGSGDTIVIGIKYEDGVSLYVAKNYWEEEYK